MAHFPFVLLWHPSKGAGHGAKKPRSRHLTCRDHVGLVKVEKSAECRFLRWFLKVPVSLFYYGAGRKVPGTVLRNPAPGTSCDGSMFVSSKLNKSAECQF